MNIRRLFEARAHPTEGMFHGLLDGELSVVRALPLRVHLAGCTSCRARLEASRVTSRQVASLIRRSSSPVGSDSGWERLVARSAERTARVGERPAYWTLVAALGLVTGAFLFAALRAAVRPGATSELLGLVRDAQAYPASTLLRDACCGDHDGGNHSDDGLLTLSRPGETVTVVIVYEDVDQSGTFTRGDIVRYTSAIPNNLRAPRVTH